LDYPYLYFPKLPDVSSITSLLASVTEILPLDGEVDADAIAAQ
jgi:hypothetical protein